MWHCAYQMFLEEPPSGMTKGEQIGKSNNLSFFRIKKTKGPKPDSKNQLCLPLPERTLASTNISCLVSKLKIVIFHLQIM